MTDACYKCGRELDIAVGNWGNYYLCSKKDGGCGKPVRFCKCVKKNAPGDV